jgi:glycerol uptake facilitator-like aquaporin
MGLWDQRVTALQLAGCVISPDMKTSQAFCIEVASSFFIFLVAFGCALDPTASKAYGPIYAPLLIGVAVGLVIFGTSALVPGYTGAGVNPARCFGPTFVANNGWKDYWLVFFLGPLTAAVAHAPIYLGMPPDHAMRQKQQQQKKLKGDPIIPDTIDNEAC